MSVGLVKINIGYIGGVVGIVGLFKVVLVIENVVILFSFNYVGVVIDLDSFGFWVDIVLMLWLVVDEL